jgi:hypothetical protein
MDEKFETIELSLLREDAIVLHAMLEDYLHLKKLDLTDKAEQNALFSLGNQLDMIISEPFEPGYAEKLEKAREFQRGRSFSIEGLG